MRPKHFPRHRPPWWPPNEPFPPASNTHASQRTRRRFFLRFGFFFLLVFMFGCASLTAMAWLTGNLLGVLGVPTNTTPSNIIAVVLIVAGLVFVGRAFGRMATPIGDLVEMAGRVAEGDYSARMLERGPREIRVLARAFNSMAERLQTQDEQRRAMLADVTHELRTPLTVIQGNLEGLLDGVYPRDDAHLAPILEETRVLARLVDDLRMLALTESGALQLQKEPVDLALLVGETAASFKAQASVAGVELIATTSQVPLLQLDPARIRQVLENLIANALRYTPRGGKISVQCSVDSVLSRVVVSTSDTGAGIAPEDLPHVFERFYKSRESRGMGLGLAIARNLVVAHGGDLIAQSEIGAGTTMRFSLPIPAK
ncbi:MAG: HAMP domain-containing histidine kinase [Chloroflexi bacterium]|nr:HAMP domain-containing histidine kinase [Chloroflexota bacterium]